jgi:hypothetical protein
MEITPAAMKKHQDKFQTSVSSCITPTRNVKQPPNNFPKAAFCLVETDYWNMTSNQKHEGPAGSAQLAVEIVFTANVPSLDSGDVASGISQAVYFHHVDTGPPSPIWIPGIRMPSCVKSAEGSE